METTKLYIKLKSLSKEELRLFRHFIRCKIFNKREDPIRFFDYLKDELKASKPKIDKETVFQHLFPGKKYNDTVIRNLKSYLSAPLDQFLAYRKLHANREDELIALCNALRERNLFHHFEIAIKKATTQQQQSTTRDSDFHYRNYRLEQERYYASTQKGRADTTNLSEVAQNLDISYFANRLRQSCYMLSHQSMFKITYDFTMVNYILAEVKRNDLLHIPAISIYYYCYLAQAFPDNVNYFKSFRHNLITNSGLFALTELKDIYLLAINIAIKRHNRGYSDVIGDLLDLYQSGIDQKVLLTNNFLSRFTYKNIIAIAINQKQFDRAESFLNDYAALLEEDYREMTYQYNLAKIYCEKKEYDSALNYLFLTASSDDVYINIDTKILLARIYYEQNELDAQIALNESFKKILNRKKEILGYHYNSYKNFLTSITKLSALNPFDKKERSTLLEEIKNTKPLPDKHWFLEQLK